MSSCGVASSIKKKRKITSTSTSPLAPSCRIENITQLPHDSIVAIADYLPKTSRALLAVALTAPSSSFRGRGTGEISEASRAIITSNKLSKQFSSFNSKLSTHHNANSYYQKDNTLNALIGEYYNGDWDILDFIDIQHEYYQRQSNSQSTNRIRMQRKFPVKYLSDRLTDDDVYAILVCIDAKHTLNKLRLCRCAQLSGDCLDPLRGSLVLKHITLGKVYRHSTTYGDMLSEDIIIPILDSIVDNSGNALRELTLPSRWMDKTRIDDPPLSGFLAKFNQMMLTKVVKCVKCEADCPTGNTENSCQICFKRICADCDEEPEDGWFDPEEQPFIKSCGNCNKHMCGACGDFAICMECDSVHCSSCAELDVVGAAKRCGNYNCDCGTICLECRDPDYAEGCDDCQKLVYSKLLEEKNELAEEVERLTKEVERLNKEHDEH